MKRVLTVMAIVATSVALSGVALAWGPGMGPGWRGAGAGGPGWTGGGPMMGGGPGWMGGGCGGFRGAGGQAAQISEDKAREIATEYVQKYFTGFSIERILPSTGRLHTMYQVEMKGPKGETRYFHVTPWGGVRAWGPPAAS